MGSLNQSFGLKLQHVPYAVTEQAMLDVTAGTILASFVSMPNATPHIQSDRVRALAVGSLRPLPLFPGVPTLAELVGRPDLDAGVWYGVPGPAGLPDDIVAKLYGENSKAVASPRAVEFMGRLNISPQVQGPAEFAASLARDVAFAGQLLAGVTAALTNAGLRLRVQAGRHAWVSRLPAGLSTRETTRRR